MKHRIYFVRVPSRSVAVLAFFLLLSPGLLRAQYYGEAQVPRDQSEAERMRTEVETRPIPQDPGLVYDDAKEARGNVGFYRSMHERLPDAVQSFDENKKRFHQTIATLRSEAKDQQKCIQNDAMIRIDGGLRTLYGLMSPAPSTGGVSLYDIAVFNKSREDVDRLYNEPRQQVCRDLAPGDKPLAVEVSFDAEVDATLKKLKERENFASTLQSAWEARLVKLNQTLAQQKQAFDILKYLPWIVALLCLFSMGVLFVVRFFTPDIQMELVGSGQVVQFPTVMALLVVVVALGLPGILKENTLAALLGGIGGYVLSQGVGRAAAREGERRARMNASSDNSAGGKEIESLVVSPSNSTVAVGGHQTVAAIATSPDGSVRDLSSVVSWNVSDEEVASVASSNDDQVVVSGIAKGSAVITARLNGMMGRAKVSVS